MDTVRDLGRIEPWQASLERSRARRDKPSRDQTCRERPPAQKASSRRPARSRPRNRKATRARIRARRAAAIFALVVPAVVLLTALAGRGSQGSAVAARAQAGWVPAHPQDAAPGGAGPLARWQVSRVTEAAVTRGCRPASAPGDYVNPLAGAHVKPERIDQGVDYAGSGTLGAIGAATITYAATADTEWPGSFVEYRLLDGPEVGCYVYYAEGVNPLAGLRVGETVAPGQPIARIVPGWLTGIELGWGAGVSTATYAAETHEWSATSDQDSVPSAAGKSFSALIAALGGPPGRVEG